MKGKTLVIIVLLSVVLIVGAIYFAMMATINKIKEENDMTFGSVVLVEENQSDDGLIIH